MEPALTIGLLWVAFAGTHVALATQRVRAALVTRLGEGGFTLLFSLVAAATFALLVRTYALERFAGAPGPALGTVLPLRVALIAAVLCGTALAIAGVLVFPTSPMAMFAERVRLPRGLARVTRHPFLVGMALSSGAHALLASRLVGTIFFGGIALLAAAGARHQDGKLLARRGQPYADYLAATSALPFAAILGGRQHLVWRELPGTLLALSIVLALALRAVHEHIFASGGAWVIGTTVGGAFVLTLASWLSTRTADAAGGWIGRSLVGIGVLHSGLGLVMLRGTFATLAAEGFFNTVNGQPEREFAFWFVATGLLLVLLGAVVDDAERRGHSLPAFLGWGLGAFALVGVVIMPASGFWLLFLPALARSRQLAATDLAH